MNLCGLTLLADGTMAAAFWQGLWTGVFELVALGIIAFRVRVLYERFRQRSTARQELIDEIDEFTTQLYKPRKIYQALVSGQLGALEGDAGSGHRRQYAQRWFEELIGAESRFRSLQVKIVPLYGYHVELFAYYLVIWRYLKEVRRRMARLESLVTQRETRQSDDRFYALIDTFRYRMMTESFAKQPPGLTTPPPEVLREMQRRADALYAEHFGPGGEAVTGE